FKPAVNTTSIDGLIYMMGWLVSDMNATCDLWIVETGPSNSTCYPVATTGYNTPGPRFGHASLLQTGTLIMFGGDTGEKGAKVDLWDNNLYLLDTCEFPRRKTLWKKR